MTRQEVYETLVVPALVKIFLLVKVEISLLVQVLPEEISFNSHFKNDLKLDSLDLVDFLCEVEDMYDGNIILDKSEENTKAIYEAAKGTVQDIVDVLLIIINDFEKENNNGNN